MFVQHLHDVIICVVVNDHLARVNVELEQSAHRIDRIVADRYVKRSLASVVDRILIDADQRTQQLARACTTIH